MKLLLMAAIGLGLSLVGCADRMLELKEGNCVHIAEYVYKVKRVGTYSYLLQKREEIRNDKGIFESEIVGAIPKKDVTTDRWILTDCDYSSK